MKKYIVFLFFIIFFRLEANPLCQKYRCVNVLAYQQGASITHVEVDQAIRQAIGNNYYLYFPKGNYPFESELVGSGGLKIIADEGARLIASPVHINTPNLWKRIELDASGKDIHIEGLIIENIALYFFGRNEYQKVNSIKLHHNKFINGEIREYNIPQEDYNQNIWDHNVSLYAANNVSIKGNLFKRDAHAMGRALYLHYTSSIDIEENRFEGFLVTAINLTGFANGTYFSKDISIKNNSIHRYPGAYPEDHGIYAKEYYNLVIDHNVFSGWSSTSCGFAIKVRNSEHTTIVNNTIQDSGILTYLYTNSRVLKFDHVLIQNNKIGLNGRVLLHNLNYCDDYSDFSIGHYAQGGYLGKDIKIYSNLLTSNIADSSQSISPWNNLVYRIVDKYPDWKCANTPDGNSLWYLEKNGPSSATNFNGSCERWGKLVEARFLENPRYPGWACFDYIESDESLWLTSTKLPTNLNPYDEILFSSEDLKNTKKFPGKCSLW